MKKYFDLKLLKFVLIIIVSISISYAQRTKKRPPKKSKTNFTIPKTKIEDLRWQLIELNGKPIKSNKSSHYLIFHSNNNSLEAKANCNQMSHNYTIKNNSKITILLGISTMMACPDSIEQDFVDALEKVDTYKLFDNKLILLNSQNIILAVCINEK